MFFEGKSGKNFKKMLKKFLKYFLFLATSIASKQEDLFVTGYKTYLKSSLKGPQHKLDISSLLSGVNPTCLNGKSRSSLSYKQYLQEFTKGPCSPILIVPGIGGSKLIVSINCPIFKEKNPELFKLCGWNTCDSIKAKKERRFEKPKDEYLLWVPEVDSPFSIANPFSNGAMCFSKIIGFEFKENFFSGKVDIVSPAGIEIKPIGMSKMTSSMGKSECGFEAIEDLLPLAFQPSGFKYFENLKDYLKKLGYDIGLTMQALPYDWRKGYKENSLDEIFLKILDEIFELTGKKVTIVAHSMGNYQVLHNLWKMSQEEKDQKISRWLSFAPPFLGSVTTVMNLIGLNDELSLNVKLFKLGVTATILKNTVNKYPTNYQLGIKRFFQVHRNQPWMKALKRRIMLEKGKNSQEKTGESIMDIFPKITEKCTPGFVHKSSDCKLGLDELWNVGLIEELEINPDTLNDILDIYGALKLSSAVNKQIFDKRFEVMENPGVQINIVYTSLIPTLSKIFYNSDPRDFTIYDHVYPPDRKEFYNGDEEVLVTSAIAPGIKWAHEHQQKIVKGAKPVTFIEMCSEFNQRDSVFKQGKTEVEKSEYFGIDCDCRTPGNIMKSNGKNCGHKGMMEDPNVVQFVANSVLTYEEGKIGKRFEKFEEVDFKKYVNLCFLFKQKKDKIIKRRVDKG